MKGLEEELNDLMEKYIGGPVTKRFEVRMRQDLLETLGKYLDGIDHYIELKLDEQNPHLVHIGLTIDGSVVCSCSLAELPEYLAHGSAFVRDLARRRFKELKGSGEK